MITNACNRRVHPAWERPRPRARTHAAEELIASARNLHAGHLRESLLVEMKGAGASKPCALSVP